MVGFCIVCSCTMNEGVSLVHTVRIQTLTLLSSCILCSRYDIPTPYYICVRQSQQDSKRPMYQYGNQSNATLQTKPHSSPVWLDLSTLSYLTLLLAAFLLNLLILINCIKKIRISNIV